MATSYTSNKKIGALDSASTPLAAANEIVINQNGDILKTSLSAVEAKIFDAKTALAPVSGTEVVVVRQTDNVLRQVALNNIVKPLLVTNAMVSESADIADSKLAQINTAGKVTNQAVQAVSTNTASRIVARDGSGNFAAGTITATLSGNASTATVASGVVDASISTAKIADGAVTSAKIANDTIVDDDIKSDAAIAGTKILPNFGPQNVTTSGDLYVTKTSGVVYVAASMETNATVNAPIIAMNRTGTGSTATPNNTRLGEIRFTGRDTSNAYMAPVMLGADIGTNAAGSAPGEFVIWTTPSGGSLAERLRVTSTGNVGIGTSSPSTKLQVNGTVTATAFTGTASAVADGAVSQSKLAANVAGNGPVFRAYANAQQNITNGSTTKVNFAAQNYDTNSNYSDSRFTPTVAGYYQINASLEYVTPHALAGSASIYKNGTLHSTGAIIGGAGATQNAAVSDIVLCNGTTDYIEIYTYQGSNSGALFRTIEASTSRTYFSGCLIRAI